MEKSPFYKSLKKETRKRIKEKYPTLIENWYLKHIDNLYSDKSWVYIIVGICIGLCIVAIKNWFPFFNFLNIIPFEKDTTGKLLDSRIGNIVTMLSFSLSIATFLINSNEKKTKESKEILIKKIWLYPTLYLAFVILFTFIIISLLKNSISIPLFNDLVIYLHALILVLIFCVATLFKNIVYVINPNFTNEGMRARIIIAMKKSLYIRLTIETSKSIFNDFISIHKIDGNYYQFLKANHSKENVLSIPDNAEITDINLYRLNRIMKKVGDSKIVIPHNILHLLSSYSYYGDDLLYIYDKDNKLKKDIFKSFTFQKVEPKFTLFQSYETFMERGLAEAMKKNNTEDFDFHIELYGEVFTIYFTIVGKSDEINFENKQQGYYDIERMGWVLENHGNDVLKEDNDYFFHKIVSLILRNTISAILNYQIKPFTQYLNSFINFYPKILKANECGNGIYDSLVDFKYIHSHVLTLMDNKITEFCKRQQFNIFYQHFFYSYSTILYNILSVFHLESNINETYFGIIYDHFEKYAKEISDIVNKLENDNFSIRYSTSPISNEDNLIIERIKWGVQSIIIVRSWIIDIYRKGNIDIEKFNMLMKNLKLRNKHDQRLPNIFESILSVNRNDINLSDWGYIRPERQKYMIRGVATDEWIKFSFTIELLKNAEMIEQNMNNIPIDSPIRYWGKDIEKNIKEIKEKFKIWRKVIFTSVNEQSTVNDDFREQVETREKRIIASFSQLEQRYDLSIAKIRAKQPLSTTKIQDFKNEVIKNWRNSDSILSIFDHFKNIQILTEPDKRLFQIGWYSYFEIKMMFVEDEYTYVNGVTSITSDIKHRADKYLWETALKAKKTRNQPKPIIEIISKAIFDLEKKGYEANVIIIGADLEFKIKPNKISDSPISFNWQLEEKEKSKIGIGFYQYSNKNIPILISYLDDMDNKIIVADFAKACQLQIVENEKWVDNRLCLDVEPISEQKANEMYETEEEDWLIDKKYKIPLEKEDAIIQIQNHVILSTYIIIKILIQDKNAFEVLGVTES